MVRVALEAETLRAARALLREGHVSAHVLRTVLEPWLVRSLAVEPRELVEGELHWFLERSLGSLQPAGATHIGAEAADALLVRFGSVERAFELARLSAREIERRIEQRDPAQSTSPFAVACVSALTTLHTHRSTLALARVALALADARSETGALPVRLEDVAARFADGLPLDPRSGMPFPYSVEGSRTRLGPAECAEGDWAAAVERLLAWDL
jgi:hypothetical protein